ncbi:hypothetical protein [Streptomyces sp. NPDC059909]|uniref:hypothetical protein n=1 Tax=Streptomyces sp. NPDC059909 TaxID=3346998 RepID=UPI003653542F
MRPHVVGLHEALDGTARAREDNRQITFSERGNIQGAQFQAVAAPVYERARERRPRHEIPREWPIPRWRSSATMLMVLGLRP